MLRESGISNDDLQQILNVVFFMELPPTPTSKPLTGNRKNGLFTIAWE
jgi:hypothetical protein